MLWRFCDSQVDTVQVWTCCSKIIYVWSWGWAINLILFSVTILASQYYENEIIEKTIDVPDSVLQ